MSYSKAVDFVLRYQFTEMAVDCGRGLCWKAFQMAPSPYPEPRFIWEVFKDGKCILDSRDIEPSFKGKSVAYPSLVDAVSACGRYMERYYPDVVLFD